MPHISRFVASHNINAKVNYPGRPVATTRLINYYCLGLTWVAVLVVFAVSVQAYQRPNFAGRWVSDPGQVFAQNPNGVSHGAILEITQDPLYIRLTGVPRRWFVIKLDGSESKNFPAGEPYATGAHLISRAQWDGDLLLITSRRMSDSIRDLLSGKIEETREVLELVGNHLVIYRTSIKAGATTKVRYEYKRGG